MIRFLLDALEAAGVEVVAARLALRPLLPPNVSPFGDVTTDGGWTGLTGNQIWILSSVLSLIFAPIFADTKSMVRKNRGLGVRSSIWCLDILFTPVIYVQACRAQLLVYISAPAAIYLTRFSSGGIAVFCHVGLCANLNLLRGNTSDPRTSTLSQNDSKCRKAVPKVPRRCALRSEISSKPAVPVRSWFGLDHTLTLA